MTRRARAVVATAVATFGIPLALVFGGGGVASCLGPLNVSEVQCAKATGLVSTVGAGVPALVLVVAISLLVLIPMERHDWLASTGALVAGAVAAGALYLVVRPRTLEGLDSRGEWMSVTRPLDAQALLAVSIAGASAAFVILAVRLRRRAVNRPSDPLIEPRR